MTVPRVGSIPGTWPRRRLPHTFDCACLAKCAGFAVFRGVPARASYSDVRSAKACDGAAGCSESQPLVRPCAPCIFDACAHDAHDTHGVHDIHARPITNRAKSGSCRAAWFDRDDRFCRFGQSRRHLSLRWCRCSQRWRAQFSCNLCYVCAVFEAPAGTVQSLTKWQTWQRWQSGLLVSCFVSHFQNWPYIE
jgi:hypothetical protein